jgi:hypothetical protein
VVLCRNQTQISKLNCTRYNGEKIYLIGIREELEWGESLTVVFGRITAFRRRDASKRIRVRRAAGRFEKFWGTAVIGPTLLDMSVITAGPTILLQLKELEAGAKFIDQLLDRAPLTIVRGREQALNGGAFLQRLFVTVPRMGTPSWRRTLPLVPSTNDNTQTKFKI